jgi:hypothetical protein
MQKTKFFLVFVSMFILFVNLSEGQTSRVNKSKAKKFTRPPEINKQGCHLVSFQTNGNKVVTAHYNCAADVTNLTLSQIEIIASCSSQNSCQEKITQSKLLQKRPILREM